MGFSSWPFVQSLANLKRQFRIGFGLVLWYFILMPEYRFPFVENEKGSDI